MVEVLDLQIRILLAHQFAIGHAGLVQRMIRHRVKRGLQSGQIRQRGVGARQFVPIERQTAVVAIHRDQALAETALGDRAAGALLAEQTELVQRLAADAFQRRDGIRTDPLMRLRVDFAQAEVVVIHEGRIAHTRIAVGRHHFGAAGNDQIFAARADHRGRQIDRRDARAAVAVERHAAGANIEAGVECGHPRQIAALLPALRAGAPDDVVDERGVELIACRKGFQHRRAEVLRMKGRQRAFAGLAYAAWRAAGVDDPGF